MKYDEIRIELSPDRNGRIGAQVGFAGAASQRHTFAPPAGVAAADLFDTWYDTLDQPATPELRRGLAERRRAAGDRLFEAVFKKTAAQLREHLTALDQRQAAGGEKRGLRLRFLLGDAVGRGKRAPDLLPAAALPWEYLHDPERERFLGKSPYVSIVRTLGGPEPPRPVEVAGPLRVLVAVSQPKGPDPLDWRGEVKQIRETLGRREETAIEVLENASFDATCERLAQEDFHILHFIGHGNRDPGSGQFYALFENAGEREPVIAEDLADRLSEIRTLRVALLAACRSGELPRETGDDPLAGVAAALSVRGVPVVVAMQVSVTDTGALDFARSFYGALREEVPVETAVADGRFKTLSSSPEWATPVLYMRGESSDLFEFRTQGPVLRSEGPRELKVGIRTFVESEKFPALAAWAKDFDTRTERLLALEEFFDGRFIRDPADWGTSVLPRLDRFLGLAVDTERPLALSLAAHATVAFAAGYFFHGKSATRLSLQQVSPRESEWWREGEGARPQDPLWQDFEVKTLSPDGEDFAVAVEVSNGVTAEAERYLAASGIQAGRIVRARIAGEPGRTRVESGAHAHELAWRLDQWLKENTGDRSRRRLHLFVSAPNAFLFFFGQMARNLGRVQLYEYDFEGTRHGTYEPSLALPWDPSAVAQR